MADVIRPLRRFANRSAVRSLISFRLPQVVGYTHLDGMEELLTARGWEPQAAV